jgi:small subunit ribosomal protein S8
MTHDPIADMLIRMKNSSEVNKATVTLPYSKLKAAILEVLKENGFIKSFSKKGKKNKSLEIELLFGNSKPKIKGVKKISKFSRKIYKGVRDIHPVRQGYGLGIFSTPKGILSDKNARKEKVGGELLFEIW